MDIYENEAEAEIILTSTSEISLGNMISFEDPFGETIGIKNELFRQIDIYSDIDIYFTTNKLYFTSMKKHFLVFKIKYPQSFFDRIFNEEYKVIYGIERSNNILVCFAVINAINREADILALGVIKEYQNRKIGSKILKKVCEELTSAGIDNVRLIVQVNNDAGVRLYKNFDFSLEKYVENYYKQLEWEDSHAFIMKKELIKKKFWIFKVFKRIADKIFHSSDKIVI
jgi:ribosomal protein S18 acetylase RimI-like enzyme